MIETNIKNLVINKMTQAQYDALEVKDPNQLYYIVDDEMYVDVARLAIEVDAGKQLIANAINDKGGESSADESFNQLATDIINIPTNIQVEDAANLAFPESIAWNILKEAYAQQRVGYASWIVAEFFKGYDTIPLSGADAFYTCDGDFYTSATTHTWHDESYNKVNRFVVYYFTGENAPFSVTQESLCPRSMAVMGKIGSINIASAGRIRQIYNGGEINDISFASTNPWCDEVLLGGVKEHNSGYILYNNNNVQMFASDIEVLNGGSLSYTNVNNTSLSTIIFPKLKVINSGFILSGGGSNMYWTNFESLSLPVLEEMSGGYLFYIYNFNGFKLENLELPKLRFVGSGAYLFYFTYGYGSDPANIRSVKLPSLVDTRGEFLGRKLNYSHLDFQNLILLEIGIGYNTNLVLASWKATNAIKDTENSLVDEEETFANNREKFLYNFEHYIVDKLADNSETGLSFTITLYSAVYNIVSATTAITDKLTAKHWNLASA